MVRHALCIQTKTEKGKEMRMKQVSIEQFPEIIGKDETLRAKVRILEDERNGKSEDAREAKFSDFHRFS